MNAVCINSSPFKGEAGRGMGFSGGDFVDQTTVSAPSPTPFRPTNRKRRFRDLPLEGEGEEVHPIAL